MPFRIFPIDLALAELKTVTGENLNGVLAAALILQDLREGATPLTCARKLGEGWEVTLVIPDTPDHSCAYALVPICEDD